MSDRDSLAYLTGGSSGAPAVKFDQPGAKVVGRVLAHELTQQRDFQTKKPKFWDDGNPMMQAVVTLQLEEWEPIDEDDDGKRRLFVAGKRLTDAVRDAIRASGHKGDIVGGRLSVTFTGYGEKTAGLSAPKEYRAKYAPPTVEDLAAMNAPAEGEPSDPDEEPF